MLFRSDGANGKGPIDRRENPKGDADQLREDIMGGMELVQDDVADCIQSWIDAGEKVDGKVNIGFQIDQDGLQDAWVTDVEAIPDGPKSCFASAIYGVDWSGISEEPIEITFPFTVRAEPGSP